MSAMKISRGITIALLCPLVHYILLRYNEVLLYLNVLYQKKKVKVCLKVFMEEFSAQVIEAMWAMY